jgi:hypothetical protein
MTTFTTDDIESLKTEWFPYDLAPVHEGEYEVMTTKWPWPHRAEWTKEYGWGMLDVDQWRGLKVQIS